MKKFLGFASIGLFVCSLAQSALAATVTIQSATPSVGNCYPFGGSDNAPGWTPYSGFVYGNIPAFSLQPGDTLAFDLGAPNDVNLQMQIDMVATTTNGGDVPAAGYTTVVSNTALPQNPLGDATLGNFELRFTVEQAFNFSGGGLIIRFSNPSAAYAADATCDQVMNNADSTDVSGYFVSRFFADADGLPVYDNGDSGNIGAFQVIYGEQVAPVPTLSEWGMIILTGSLALGTLVTLRRQGQ